MKPSDYNDIDAIRFSRLKRMDISPRHYKEYAQKETEPMRVGRALHLAVLEPGRYPHEVAVWEGKVRRGSAWELFQEANRSKTILRQADHERAMGMQKAVWQNRHASELLSGGEAETVRGFVDASTRLKCKARIDYNYTFPSRGVDAIPHVVDLKSTARIRPREFASQCAQLQYHAQLAFYTWNLDVDCYIIAVTKEEPYDVVVYRLPDEALQAGRRLCRRWLDRVAECEAADHWPGIGGDQINELQLPTWALADDTPANLTQGGKPVEVE
jgi:hypothetical protein